ncbi:hypothetical protein AB2S62_21840 [Vibrio sp. NTOU-M3]|uniref:hypothetical protein n=1 Tax=Vibrio sp. NTOU-M3 TaxID=3234954 RepID=UPI00349F687E
MIYLRVIGCILMALWGYVLVNRQINTAISTESVIKVDGLLNVWGSYAIALIFTYLTIYYFKEKLSLSLRIGDINRVLIILTLIIAPLFSLANYSQSKSNIANYVECKNERSFSSRYSSRTYAVNEEVCLALEASSD